MNQIWDELYINRCFELAINGLGLVSPNPLVGAVLVKDGKVIGEGFHGVYGGAHAEPDAISKARESVEGATLYCNLEPCCHTNKQTAPCVDLIISKKIKRVVVSNLDPNPYVAGKGIAKLQEAGIETSVGILQAKGELLNEVFFKWIQTGLPFVHLKWAQTLDGKISTLSGDSKWISDEVARAEVHSLRVKYDGVLVGRLTVNRDDPRLDIRLVDSKGKTPWRIIVGDTEKINSESYVAKNCDDKTLYLGKIEDNKDAWLEALRSLGERKITSILVEGGGRLLSSFLKYELYDRISVYVAPKIVGAGKSYYDEELKKMSESLQLNLDTVTKITNQVRLDFKRG